MSTVRLMQLCRTFTTRSCVGSLRNYNKPSIIKIPNFTTGLTILPQRLFSTESDPSPMKENEFAHNLLEKIVAYQTKVVTLPDETYENTEQELASILNNLDVDALSLDELLLAAESVSQLDTDSRTDACWDESFQRITERITDLIPSASEAEIKRMIGIYSRMAFKGSVGGFRRQLSRLAMTIKLEVDARPHDWSTDSLLYCLDFLNHTNRRALTSGFLEKFVPLVDSMTKEQTILLLHIMSISYSSHRRHDVLSKLEVRLEDFFDDCSTQELAVASLGFFRSRYVPQSQGLIEKFTARLNSDLNSLDEMTIVSLIKIINYSTRNGVGYSNSIIRENMRAVTSSLLPRIRDFSPSSCTNLFRISSSLHQLNHSLMDALCQKVVKSDIDKWRLKDLAWFTFTFGQFQCMMEEKQWFYDKIIKSLEKFERRSEIADFPNALIQALVGLSMVGIYPNNLIHEVLSRLFRSQIKDKVSLDLSRDLFFIDQGVRLERPNYDGNLLPDNFLEKMPPESEYLRERKLPHDKVRPSKRDDMLLQIQSSLDLLCGQDMCAEIAFVFRHHNTADIVLKVNEYKKPIPIYEWKTDELSVADKSDQSTIIVLVAAPNSFVIYDTEYGYARKLLASHVTKRRQAELLGHSVIEIPYFKWFDRSANRRQLLIDACDGLVNFDQ